MASRSTIIGARTSLALLEPALLATLTGIVGLIALSFFLPLFSLLGGVNAR